jgi:hypothetical protein
MRQWVTNSTRAGYCIASKVMDFHVVEFHNVSIRHPVTLVGALGV